MGMKICTALADNNERNNSSYKMIVRHHIN